MGLFTGFLRPAQALVAAPSYPKDLVAIGAAAMAAGASKPVQQLAHQPAEPDAGPVLPAAVRTPIRPASSTGKRRQLNIRVSGELHRRLAAAAKRRRVTLTDLVIAYCEAGLQASSQ